ncbi:hypothetical protein GCM10009785_21840 [Brooklawnia cerclae]|uniref:Uncharacterized protein n=1 Tax=Brooklawnia cerclae TaxID=349934 RepID=A0ABX0SFZ2_9ACTN|nr:hypothetical protein [Brooklawnia cerclae]NIH57297.1 hypothetical protein [Brooklawnia cerclae]
MSGRAAPRRRRPTSRMAERRRIVAAELSIDAWRAESAQAAPRWDREPVAITLPVLRKGRDWHRALADMGVPPRLDDLDVVVHLPRGGWQVFTLPPMPEACAWVLKASRHPDAAVWLTAIARIGLHSQLTLSEALALAAECARLDPRAENAPRNAADEWAWVGICAVSVWQARGAGGEGVGDPVRCAELLAGLRTVCAGWQVAQLETDLERARARLRDERRWR